MGSSGCLKRRPQQKIDSSEHPNGGASINIADETTGDNICGGSNSR